MGLMGRFLTVHKAGCCRLLSKRNKPICTVSTNLSSDRVPKEFTKEMVTVIADVLKKPEKLISVRLETNANIRRGTDDAPTAIVDIWSIGVFEASRNEYYTPLFYDFLTKHLDIPEERIALLYHPLEPHAAGHLTQMRLREEGKLS